MKSRHALALWMLLLACAAVVYAQGTRIEPGNLRVTGTSLNLGSAPLAQAAIQMNSGSPLLIWQETDAASNNKIWDVLVTAEEWILRAVNDAYSSAGSAITITRTGTQVDTVILGAAATLNTGRYDSAAAQPGFLAFNSVTDSPVSSLATVEFDSEVYDTGGVFASNTFTASITGYYLLCAFVEASGGTTNGVRLVTSNRTYVLATDITAGGTMGSCVFADMEASDTATVQVYFSDGSGLVGGSSSPLSTYFSGRLVP